MESDECLFTILVRELKDILEVIAMPWNHVLLYS